MSNLTAKTVARYIDHTDVKPDAGRSDIKKLCQEAVQYHFHSVCVTPFRVKDARDFLGKRSALEIICVIGFPFGLVKTQEKINEAIVAVKDGATEIDMVINIGAIKDKSWDYIYGEISQIANAIKPIGLKVIMEVGFITKAELTKACKIAKKAGAAFVKTATGYGPRGASVSDIKLMRKTVGPKMGIKASGGIHDFNTAKKMIEAGANRLGTSSGLQIIGTPNLPKIIKKHKHISNE